MFLNLSDQDFEETIKKEKLILIDFWAEWCSPCLILSPMLEKVAEGYKEKIVFAKANLDDNRIVAEKYSIDRIPALIIFKDGNPISDFIGLRPESEIQEWIEKNIPSEKKYDEVIAEYEEYAKKYGFRLNPNKEIVKTLIRGLFENEKKYGKRYCPCRRIIGSIEEDGNKICPCEQSHEEIKKNGQCLCGLFLK